MPTVLLSAAADAPDIRAAVEAAGFAVAAHALGATPPVDFAPVAVAVVVAEPVPAAAAQTRRWRAELADEFVPVVWLVTRPEAVPVGLDAGADVCLVLPVEPAHLAAQLRSLARTRAATARVGVRAAEARLLGDQLRQAFARHDADRDLARLVHRAALPLDLPADTVRVTVCRRARARAGTDFHDARRLADGRVAFLVGDVPGRGGTTGCLLGLLALRAAFPPGAEPDPAAALERVNRELLALGLDDPPLVALLAGVADADTVTLARAGLPAPVWVPAGGEPVAWSAPGPFLGTAEASYPSLTRRIGPGDRLLVATAGALLAAARRGSVEAVATELLADGESVTVMAVEGSTSGAG
jgi:sigma-B regulation protein RsbU (phosphoserine phosphatase)